MLHPCLGTPGWLPVAADGVIATLRRVLGLAKPPTTRQVLLVVGLRCVVLGQGDDLGHDGRRHLALARGLALLRRRLLLLAVRVDARPVLRALVRALPVERGGVVLLPKHVQQLLVRDRAVVVRHLHHLAVPRLAAAHLLVRGLLSVAVAVPDLGGDHTRHALEHELGAPEAAHAERGLAQALSRGERHELHVKGEALARQLVVQVQLHLLVVQLGALGDHAVGQLHLHARLEPLGRLRSGELEHHARVGMAVRVLGRDALLAALAHRQAGDSLVEALDHHATPHHELQRGAALARRVKH
mmetsp:Transcript_9931/g.24843  ORF Transcript_9931/g.24843 Transcript_9931/m.24843 type:complete len:300 (+) Transcript_9931:184-1083(+)